MIEQLKKMNPLERLGLPEDMANVVSFLAGPEGAGSIARLYAPMGLRLKAPITSLRARFDYIVCGAGTSGCRGRGDVS